MGHCLAASPTIHSVLHLPPSIKMTQQIRQNYHEECEALVNKQINQAFYASYVYIAMASYFNQADQALPGFAHLFRRASDCVRNHGVALMEYQVKRGGKVVLQDITKPSRMEWGTPLEVMTAVLELEKTVTRTLQDLQTVAMGKKDFHLIDFIQREFLGKKVNIIKEIGDCLTKIKRVGDGSGLYIVDREIEKAMVTRTLLDLQALVNNRNDYHVTDMVQGEVLEKQVEIVREITGALANIRMV